MSAGSNLSRGKSGCVSSRAVTEVYAQAASAKTDRFTANSTEE